LASIERLLRIREWINLVKAREADLRSLELMQSSTNVQDKEIAELIRKSFAWGEQRLNEFAERGLDA